ncbi:MAG: hypothetical protein NZ874_09535 [Fimbriimonadales bacterium]|nr:hypothetical protein [Fimbriimonadales bacterium]
MAWTVLSKHRHGQDCPCYGRTGWKPVPRRGVGIPPKHLWLGQSCPSPNARTRLSMLRMHGQDARATLVGATPTLRRDGILPSEPRWRGRHRTVCRCRRLADGTTTCLRS